MTTLITLFVFMVIICMCVYHNLSTKIKLLEEKDKTNAYETNRVRLSVIKVSKDIDFLRRLTVACSDKIEFIQRNNNEICKLNKICDELKKTTNKIQKEFIKKDEICDLPNKVLEANNLRKIKRKIKNI